MKPIRLFSPLLALVLLAACVAQPEPFVEPPPSGQLLLGSGDRLQIIVLGQPDLSGAHTIDEAGLISMPLVGSIGARGRTPQGLESTIAGALRQGYLRDPDVTVQVTQFRPIFVMGEVGASGQYPYVVRLTVQQAIALAGGFSPRANRISVDIVRQFGRDTISLREGMLDQVFPGDTITVRQRLF